MLLLRNADVFAPAPLGHQSLLLGGGKVLWMGPGAQLPDLPAALRSQATVLDLEGRRLIPGLIDGHVHVTGGGGEAGFKTRVPPVPLSRSDRMMLQPGTGPGTCGSSPCPTRGPVPTRC